MVAEKTLDGLDGRLYVLAYEKARPAEKVLQTALRGVRARIVLFLPPSDRLEQAFEDLVSLR